MNISVSSSNDLDISSGHYDENECPMTNITKEEQELVEFCSSMLGL